MSNENRITGAISSNAELEIMEVPGKNDGCAVGEMLRDASGDVARLESISYTGHTIVVASLLAYKWDGTILSSEALLQSKLIGKWLVARRQNYGYAISQISNVVVGAGPSYNITITCDNTLTGSLTFTDPFGSTSDAVRMYICEYPPLFRQTRIGKCYGPYFCEDGNSGAVNGAILEGFSGSADQEMFTADMFVGMYLCFISGELRGIPFRITDNAVNTVTISSSSMKVATVGALTLNNKSWFVIGDLEDLRPYITEFDLGDRTALSVTGNNRGSDRINAAGGAKLTGRMGIHASDRKYYHGAMGADMLDTSGNWHGVGPDASKYDPTETSPDWFVEDGFDIAYSPQRASKNVALAGYSAGSTGQVVVSATSHGMNIGDEIHFQETDTDTDTADSATAPDGADFICPYTVVASATWTRGPIHSLVSPRTVSITLHNNTASEITATANLVFTVTGKYRGVVVTETITMDVDHVGDPTIAAGKYRTKNGTALFDVITNVVYTSGLGSNYNGVTVAVGIGKYKGLYEIVSVVDANSFVIEADFTEDVAAATAYTIGLDGWRHAHMAPLGPPHFLIKRVVNTTNGEYFEIIDGDVSIALSDPDKITNANDSMVEMYDLVATITEHHSRRVE